MSLVGAPERETQQRIVKLFTNELGYQYLGNLQDRADNSNINEAQLKLFFKNQGHSAALIERTLRALKKAAAIGDGCNLYEANKKVYALLRYGVKIKPEIDQQNITCWLIDWKNPNNNNFAIAEEVSITGPHNNKRPDLVLYVNGIALGVIELKRSTASVAAGIRQNIDNQSQQFIPHFFTTIQFVMAGNDTEGLRYGTTNTPERHYLEWKENTHTNSSPASNYNPLPNKLDAHLSLLCNKKRFLELIHDFIVFDAGTKKLCRHNQYFGVKKAQAAIKQRQGGMIWHAQGSGKSLTMVWLTKWIRENIPNNARVLIVTDRTELDEQIERIYQGVNEKIYRTTSGADLIHQLNNNTEWLICSLVHKFGRAKANKTVDTATDDFISELKTNIKSNFKAKGNIYVFIDECHRTQSGKLHRALKQILPQALFIGFTGTPLLKSNKQTSLEVFGPYIHTYKFDEAVKDGVILDLRYEARNIEQHITAHDKIDLWFESKTKGLNEYAQEQIKKKWGTMQKVLSSHSRLEKIVADILLDMTIRPRLSSGHGNAILVASSIYQACKFYELFDATDLHKKCAIITSYTPSVQSVKFENSGEGRTEKLHQYNIYQKMLADFFNTTAEKALQRVDEFEKKVKQQFINDPAQMKLLIVVDKLLTGFDAPAATYLYIDKKMKNHGLFQAICRVNRLHGDDKKYGYIIDYKDLFKSLKSSITDYTSGAFGTYDAQDVKGLLKNRLIQGRQQLDEAREGVKALCEPVEPPKDTPAYTRYFCIPDTSRRQKLYKKTSAFVRAYAELANEMQEAGYTAQETTQIKAEVKNFETIRAEIKLASGDHIDTKMYEPAMRHLIDSYIQASDSKKLAIFNNISLTQLIADRGTKALDELPDGIRNSQQATAATIENNVRKSIADAYPSNPNYYKKMSQLLENLVQEYKKQALEYEQFIKRIAALTQQVYHPEATGAYPQNLNTPAKKALFDNLNQDENLALELDKIIKLNKKDNWRGNKIKERELKKAINAKLASTGHDLEAILELVKNQNEY